MAHIRDYVLPLATIRFSGNKVLPSAENGQTPSHFDAQGTCVLIGCRGFALTAAHVIDQLDLTTASAVFVHNDKWHHVRITAYEKHLSEDIGVVRFAPSALLQRSSFFAVSGQVEHASCAVELWGYPRHVTAEVEREAPFEGLPQARPDLIFFRGYVRRRIPREIPISVFRGKMFYELSIVAGEACSGGPVIVRRGTLWDIAGIYVGEQTSTPAYAVGYAATADSFANWRPSILDVSVKDEAATTLRA